MHRCGGQPPGSWAGSLVLGLLGLYAYATAQKQPAVTAVCMYVLPVQRDYLTAWLALCRPLVASGAAAAAGATESPTAAAAVAAGSRCSGQGVPVGDTQERVTAEAIRVGTAVVNKYKSCVAGVGDL
jgi:hypothetical protein